MTPGRKRDNQIRLGSNSLPPDILTTAMSRLQPMPLLKRSAPFDDANWIFELKYDGFRALAVIDNGRSQLISRNGHPFASFADLAEDIRACVPNTKLTMLD